MANKDAGKGSDVKRKVVTLPRNLWLALERHAAETKVTFDALAENALRRYLKDKNVPISVREALSASLRAEPDNDRRPNLKPTRKR